MCLKSRYYINSSTPIFHFQVFFKFVSHLQNLFRHLISSQNKYVLVNIPDYVLFTLSVQGTVLYFSVAYVCLIFEIDIPQH